MSNQTYCLKCMHSINTGICPNCGFKNDTYEQPPHHLTPGTLLNNKYYVGASIGEGGFGITYVGIDTVLGIKVAIKEFFPNGFVSRGAKDTNTVTIFTGAEHQEYEKGRDRFLNEAKALAKFDSLPGIVSVKDFFYENNTAYIVMEFIEGITFKNYLKQSGGKLNPNLVFSMMEPVIRSLSSVHKKNIIHRDISPDNIMVTPDHQIKLIDFGAARETNGEGRSLSIQLKPGYAPEEQYRTKGEQGPWTDIYALCATIYKAITGVTPPDALDRLNEDTLTRPSAMGCFIDKKKEDAIMYGLGIHKNNRFADVDVLYKVLYDETEQTVAMFNNNRKQVYEQFAESKTSTNPQTAQPAHTPPQQQAYRQQQAQQQAYRQPQQQAYRPQQQAYRQPQQQTYRPTQAPQPQKQVIGVCQKCGGTLVSKRPTWILVLAIFCIILGFFLLMDISMNHIDDEPSEIGVAILCCVGGVLALISPKNNKQTCTRCGTKY